MDLLITVPDDLGARLEARWRDLARNVLENLLVEAYQEGVLTTAEVQRALALSSRWETEDCLRRAGADLHYSAADLRQDVDTLNSISGG